VFVDAPIRETKKINPTKKETRQKAIMLEKESIIR
jgi:hypothetical protein